MEDLHKDCKVDEDYSSTKQSNGIFTWIIDKGIWLGKKAVITGAVISSAPLVLPPLVVFSTLGLACSVPFGVVFATYACTQKIMSKLLPTPESSPVLEYNEDEVEDNDSVQGEGEEEQGYDPEDVDLVQRAKEQGYDVEDDDLVQQVEERGYVEEDDDLVQRAEEQGYEEDEEEEVDLEQAAEKHGRDGLLKEVMIQEDINEEMKDTPAEVNKGDILREKPIDTIGLGVMSIELDGRNNVLPEGAALLQEDVLYGQDGIQKCNEEPLEQEKLMLDVLKGVGVKNELDEDATTSMEIHKQEPIAEEEQLKEVLEGGTAMIELNVNGSSELEGGHTYQARVYDGKNSFAVLKEVSDEMKRGLLMRNDMDGEARNETQGGGISQANATYARKGVKERPIKIMEHSHEGGYKQDITKYFQVEDIVSVEGTEVRNEKLIIENINEKPVIEMRQVIVSVRGGKKITAEQENEDIKECNKSQKLVLVAKKVTEETGGDFKSVVERKNTLGDLNSAREIADECGMDLLDYTAGDHDSYNDFNVSQENDNIRSRKTDEVADLPILRVSTKVAESKHINLLPETDPLASFSEELLSEEKIWEQIDALRAIVGYSAPTRTTSVEEIKALYIFTGVEAPPSFADDSDLVEMNEKLRLLKSVVGVK